MGSPPLPIYHLAAMSTFQREASTSSQPYTEAAGLITAVVDKEWRANSVDTSGAVDADMGADMGHEWDTMSAFPAHGCCATPVALS
jgi:hypothetical protein